MAVEAEIEEGAPADKPKFKLSRKMLMIGGAALLVLLIGSASAYFLLFSSKPAPAATTEAVKPPPEGFIFNLPTMTVNLRSDGTGTDQFMKLTIALEVANQAAMTEIQPRMAKVVDAFQVYLRELRKSDLEGSAGIYRLKEELRRRVNLAVYPTVVDAILFKEILVQ
jgi:flagellar protein FliL